MVIVIPHRVGRPQTAQKLFRFAEFYEGQKWDPPDMLGSSHNFECASVQNRNNRIMSTMNEGSALFQA